MDTIAGSEVIIRILIRGRTEKSEAEGETRR